MGSCFNLEDAFEQGGIGIKRSLDEIAATYLKHDYSEPPRLVSYLVDNSLSYIVP